MIRELITDADILSGRVGSPIVLREGVCLTPAARDRAVARGMRIVERDAARAGGASQAAPAPAAAPARACANCGQPAGACASGCRCGSRCGGAGGCGAACSGTAPAASAAPACAGAHGAARLDQLADGLYLLRVSGGEVASILPASGPGLLHANRNVPPRS